MNKRISKILALLGILGFIAVIYILLHAMHMDRNSKHGFFLLFWGIAFVFIYLSYILYNFIVYGKPHKIDNVEKILQRNVLVVGLIMYFCTVELLAILVKSVPFIDEYEKFCLWYILLIMYTPMLFIACERFYYLRISSLRGYKLWKISIPWALLNQDEASEHDKDPCIFVMEASNSKEAIELAIQQFGNETLKTNQAQYVSEIRCDFYQGYKYTPNGMPSFVAVED